MPTPRTGRYLAAVVAAVVLTAPLAGCGDSEPAPAAGAEHADDGHESSADASALPGSHVHAVGVNPPDKAVYLATHEGLFRYGADGPARVGPVIDLMGFTVAGPDHFYASGHPGEGVDLPQPVGLIESTDGGNTWAGLSRQGESDFHALTSSAAGVLGFDGKLRATSDGEKWRELDAPAAPYALAASPDGEVLLGTTETGLIRSEDGGKTWDTVADAPPVILVAWAAGDTVLGALPDGTIVMSGDAGSAWHPMGKVEGQPYALGAAPDAAGDNAGVLVVTEDAVLRSTDGGASFRPVT